MLRITLAVLLLLPLAVSQDKGGKSPAVTARLVSATAQLAPGEDGLLAVVLDVPEGWHVYAPCLNDSGLPVTVTPQLPAGWQTKPAPWPAPERLVSTGDLLDHVYTGHVTLPLHVLVPAEAAGTHVTLRAHVEWMACRTACVLGHADVALELDVAATGAVVKPSPDAALFHDPRTPLPLRPGTLGVTIKPGLVVLHASGAAGLIFLPDADNAATTNLLRDAASENDTLCVHLAPGAQGSIRGVVQVNWPAGRAPEFFRVERALGADSSAPEPGPQVSHPKESPHDP